jgi:Sulfotransferase family
VQFTSHPQKLLLLKNPWCYPYFKYIQQALPNAKFIFIHRNPFGVLNSKLKAVDTLLACWNPYTSLISKRYNKIFKNPFNRLVYRTMYSQHFNLGINKVLKQSMISTSSFLNHIDTISSNSYVSIRFEDFCDHPLATLQKILDFLQLDSQLSADCQALIKKRPVQLLPTVESNKARIYKQLKPYFDFHGYSVDLN